MTHISVVDTLDRLIVAIDNSVRDLRDGLDDAVSTTAREGNNIAKGLARKTAGAHGKRYPSSFYAARLGHADYIYGPTSGKAQGGMSFEFGSRNQPPHLDLAKSADIIGTRLAMRVRAVLEDASL